MRRKNIPVGRLVFPSWSLGDEFQFNSRRYNNRSFADVVRDYEPWIDVQPEGYGIDRQFPDLLYIPENALANLREQHVSWNSGETTHSIPLAPGKVYMQRRRDIVCGWRSILRHHRGD